MDDQVYVLDFFNNLLKIMPSKTLLPLIPKGWTVPTGDKPVLGSVAWFHTIFKFIEFFSNCVSE
jgi:hypothetical protein